MFTQKLDFSLAAAPMFLVVADSKDETQHTFSVSFYFIEKDVPLVLHSRLNR